MDLEFREGIACMNLGLVLFSFFTSPSVFLGYPHHFRFTYFLYLSCTGLGCSF